MGTENTIDTKQIYNGKILNLRVDTVEIAGKGYAQRELISHRGGVCCIAVTQENKILLVKQFRKAVEQYMIELPAGTLEKGERAEDAIVRELKEETGYHLVDAEEIVQFYPSPGYTDERGYVFVGKALDKGERERIKFWEKERDNLPYETDGLVIKVDNIDLWDEIGYTSKTPRWAIAYKFPANQATTRLNAITWQVGRTGKLTPVAELQEVELSGSRVKRASLHNISEIRRKDIRIGDKVFIEKAAEIIPQVVKSI